MTTDRDWAKEAANEILTSFKSPGGFRDMTDANAVEAIANIIRDEEDDGSGSKDAWKNYANLNFWKVGLAERALHMIHSNCKERASSDSILKIYHQYFFDVNKAHDEWIADCVRKEEKGIPLDLLPSGFVVITSEDVDWFHYAVAHFEDDSEPEDITCARAFKSILSRIFHILTPDVETVPYCPGIKP